MPSPPPCSCCWRGDASPRGPRDHGSCAALSFVDGLLVADQGGVFIAGLGAALLLGNLRRDAQARAGLAIVLSSAAIVVYNSPTAEAGDLVFIPVLFAIGWLVGFALRERAEQTEAAEERPPGGERGRRPGSRWPRSADGSRASSTTSWRTPSA